MYDSRLSLFLWLQEALKVVQTFLRDVDNTLFLNSLNGCPHTLTVSQPHTLTVSQPHTLTASQHHTPIIRRDVFRGYLTRGKKKIRTYHVILTPDHVIYTRGHGKGRTLTYEFTEALKVCTVHKAQFVGSQKTASK